MRGNTYLILRKINAFQKKHFSMLQSMVDWSMVIEIGYYQECGRPLTLKQLFLQNIASATTVQRRLKRLISLGIVTKSFRPTDARMVELRVTVPADKLFKKYADWISKNAENHISGSGKGSSKGKDLSNQIKMLTVNADEKLCGTCLHWEGAREVREDACTFVVDSEGVCRYLAGKGLDFIDTLTLSTHQPTCDQWAPIAG